MLGRFKRSLNSSDSPQKLRGSDTSLATTTSALCLGDAEDSAWRFVTKIPGVFNSADGQQLLSNVLTARYARDADVYTFRHMLESEGVDGGFAVAALRTLAERELPHYTDQQGSASLELQLRAILSALVVVRRTVAQIPRDTHQILQDCMSRLEDFCKRDLRIHDNPNVAFLMRRVSKETSALKNDGTKTDVALSIGLSLGSGLLCLYGRDLMGAIEALQSSSLDWSQAWDVFANAVSKVSSGQSVLGSSAQSGASGFLAMRTLTQDLIGAWQTPEMQRHVHKATEFKERPGSLLAFELMDAFQQQSILTNEEKLPGPACEVALCYLRKTDVRHDLHFKALELLTILSSQLPPNSESQSALNKAQGSLKDIRGSIEKLRQNVSAKVDCDQKLYGRILRELNEAPARRPSEPVPGESKFIASVPDVYAKLLINGETKQTFPDGSVYVGEMKDGKFHGRGVLTRPDGERRAGTFHDGFMEGKGQVEYANGHRREGTFQGGRHREGVLTLPTGHRHEGSFDMNGNLTNGNITSPDGETRTGTFVDGKLNGEGEVVYASGQRRKGVFKEGFLNGEGKVWYENGHIREGTFAGGRHHEGTLTLPTGHVHEGSFNLDGKLEKGKTTSPNGDTQTGCFVDEKLTGQGEIIFGGKQRRVGMFKDGFLNGEGKVWYENGDIREGTFVGGRHRQGTLTLPSGHRHQGEFDASGNLTDGKVIPPSDQS